jgi:hypothetical protein
MSFDLDGVFARKVWRRLRDSSVPIVDPDLYANADDVASYLSASISDRVFLPSTIHGYLGIQKGGGVTRFLPILQARDMAVYYYLCYKLAPKILVKKKGIYGAWHMKPQIAETQNDAIEQQAEAFGQAYGSNPFSSHWWLQNWKAFTDLIREIVSDTKVGPYVISTDIANFYDSIEIPRLISEIRISAPQENDTIEALSAFLSSWNRRHTGYMPSTKGIPQEIVSDASRILAHFYLQYFDENFSKYCEENNLTYVRWSDDILVFGGSRQKLETSIHIASRLLRDLGLNLNSGKTTTRAKSDLARFRALDILHAIANDDHPKVARELKRIKKSLAKGEDLRLDTVFRAMIGYTSKTAGAKTTLNRAFLTEIGESNRDLLHSLNHTQLLRYIQLMDDPKQALKKLRTEMCKADFGSPKASYLHMMRKYRNPLAQIGMTKNMAHQAIDQIEKSSLDSEIIRDFCVPVVRTQYS